MPHLKILAGRDTGKTLSLADEIFLGREEGNTHRLPDETASRHHAKVVRLDDAYLLVDLGSNNGTFVNGERVRERFLRNGDRIRIGKTDLAFEREGETKAGDTVGIREESGGAVTVTHSIPAGIPPREETGERLRALYEVAAYLNASLEPERLLDGLTARLRVSLDADVCAAWWEGTNAVADRGTGIGGEVGVSRSALELVRNRRESILVSHVPAEEGLRDRPSIAAEKISSIVCAPVTAGESRLGILYADRRREGRPFTSDDLAFLNAAAHLSAPALDNASRYARTRERVNELSRQVVGARSLVGEAPRWREVTAIIEKAAPTDATVLLLGESGTGKELLARRLHERSPRAQEPFVAINCSTLVETLLESELFGYEKGAFTGATKRRPGKIEAAAAGTLFLDEIGEISISVQAKLLRVLQERSFYRVGGTQSIPVQARFVAATNRDLEKAVREGSFREDLYYRLRVVAVRVPPLRERNEDIPALARFFLREACDRMKRPLREFDPDVLETLRRYSWPGNVRELENVIERAVILGEGVRIHARLIPPEITDYDPDPDGWPIRVEEAEKLCIRRALVRTGGRKGEAARLLGISWPTLNKKIREWGLDENPASDPENKDGM